MTEHHDDQLDGAIRSLVARAVADAPPAPVIDEQTPIDTRVVRTIGSARSARNRWIVGGLAAMTTAAAVIAIALVARPDSAEAPAPATVPPITEPVPTTTAAPAPATTVPAVVEGTAPPTSIPVPESPGTAPSTTLAPPPEIITIAGDDGIEVDTGDALTTALVGYPASTALRVPDGRIFFQRRSTEFPGIFVYSGSDVDVPLLLMPDQLGGNAILHDAAVVEGEVVLLVESSPGNCVGPDDCIGSVWAVWPDRGDGVMLDEQNVWEAAWSRLSLANTGLAVGTFSAEVSVSPWSFVLPGSGASPLDPSAVGLEETYSDCSTCPRAFTIDSTGQAVGWLETRDDGSLTITVHSLADGWTFAYDVPDTSGLASFGSLDIGAIESAGTTLAAGAAIINDPDPTSARAAHVYDLSVPGGEPIVIGKPASRMAFGY